MALKYSIMMAIAAGVAAAYMVELIKKQLMKETTTKVMAKSREVLSDRINFKLFAAQRHLDKLKNIEKQYGHIGANRLYAEMELDCFFAQIIGAKDSLLMRINEKLGLGIDDKVVNLDEVYLVM